LFLHELAKQMLAYEHYTTFADAV